MDLDNEELEKTKENQNNIIKLEKLEDFEIIEKFIKDYKDKGFFGIISKEQIDIFDNLLNDYKIYKSKLKEIESIVDTSPYVAYTDYGDLLYESDDILSIIRGEK